MPRIFHAAALGVIGAVILHIVILFILPSYAGGNAWTRLFAVAEPYKPLRLDQLGITASPGDGSDPLFRVVACRFNLADGVVRFTATGSVPFWSASVYDGSGQNLYSLNDRATPDGDLDFVLLTPAQMTDIRKGLPDNMQQSSFVESTTTDGIAVVRTFVPDDTWSSTVKAFLDSLSCQPQRPA